jgi:membrane protease YdiL (CAAX protease family)
LSNAPQPPATADNSLARYLPLWEIISVTSSALIAEWSMRSFFGKGSLVAVIPIVLALSFMLYSHLQRREGLYDLGFRFDNFLPALRLVALPTLFAVVLVIVGSWYVSDALSLRPFRSRLLLVPLWALFQQYGLQSFMNRRAQLFAGASWWSAALVGVVFAVLHIPSPLLITLAFIGGIVWGRIYQKQPNLFALAISHAIVSLSLSLLFPADSTYLLRVGFRYFG